MATNQPCFHGSDIEKIAEHFKLQMEDILNFSSNVSPLLSSEKASTALAQHTDILSSYPDRSYTALKNAIAKYSGTKPDQIILGNGVTELITLFINELAPSTAMVVGPTYSEYDKDLSKTNCTIVHYNTCMEEDFVLSMADLQKNIKAETNLCIICNPNNPTSYAFTPDQLKPLLDYLNSINCYCIIDETYAEFEIQQTSVSCTSLIDSYENLIILRGTSKFFATPGMRLGYALCCNHNLVSNICASQDPWNINTVADFVGQIMFNDSDYIKNVKNFMQVEMKYLYDSLSEITGMKCYLPQANFVLCKLPTNGPDSATLFEHLIKQNLMIRNCSSFPGLMDSFIRICPLQHKDNELLVTAIKKEYQQ